ncbi:MAG: hypothetical protein H7235_00470 [Bdellovibrionaceae bacterium]|nr:hypothetical protein [Pseudobdellovibrionaceae bacterium]
MLNSTATKITSLLLLSFVVMSCQKNDTDLLQEAQSCLNTSPSREARNCVSKISSISTPAASKLKCAAIYIQEGFGAASSLINGLNDMNNPSGGGGCAGNCSPTFAVINNFNFHSGDNLNSQNQAKNIATANEAVEVCSHTESKGYIQVSSLFKIGTMAKMSAFGALVSPTPGQEPTPTQIQAAIVGLPQSEIGQLVTTTYSLACTNITNPSDSTKKYCDQLSGSIGTYGSNFSAIGQCLLGKINNEAYVCP